MHRRTGRLNPAARGWSRQPLHRANLPARDGHNKRWDYWAVLAGDLVVSAVYSDVDRFGLADVYWADLVTGAARRPRDRRPGRGRHVAPRATGHGAARASSATDSTLRITDDDAGHAARGHVDGARRPRR